MRAIGLVSTQGTPHELPEELVEELLIESDGSVRDAAYRNRADERTEEL